MRIKFNFIIRTTLFIIGILTSFSLILSDKELPYALFTIPLSYSIFILIFPSMTKYLFKYIGVIALNICMFLRYVISPLFNSFNGVNISTSIIPSESSFNIAIVLMLYEMFAVFFIFALFHKYFYKLDKKQSITFKYNFTGWLYVIICLVLILMIPSLLNSYTFILTADQLENKNEGLEIVSTIPLILQLGSLVLIVSVLNMLYRKYLSNNNMIYILCSLVTVLIFSSFIIGTSRFSIILPLITGLFLIYLLYKKNRVWITVISATAIFIYITLSSLLKNKTINSTNSSVQSIYTSLNEELQLYFSGINNVAVSVQTADIFSSFNLNVILSDVFRSVVFVNSFFKNEISAFELYNIVFYNGGPARDQILPMIGQGFLYFGFFFAPIFSIMILIIMMYIDSKMMNTTNIFLKSVYIFAVLKCGLFMMANFTNVIAFLTNQVLVLILLFLINDLIQKKKRVLIVHEHR